jgi:hypothetical protein
MSTNVRIDHDGAFGFTFYGANEVSRAALFTDAFAIIEHYVFPAISGGKVMTVTPAGAASKPGGAPPDVTFNGDGARTLTVTATSLAASTSKTGTMNATVPA